MRRQKKNLVGQVEGQSEDSLLQDKEESEKELVLSEKSLEVSEQEEDP